MLPPECSGVRDPYSYVTFMETPLYTFTGTLIETGCPLNITVTDIEEVDTLFSTEIVAFVSPLMLISFNLTCWLDTDEPLPLALRIIRLSSVASSDASDSLTPDRAERTIEARSPSISQPFFDSTVSGT